MSIALSQWSAFLHSFITPRRVARNKLFLHFLGNCVVSFWPLGHHRHESKKSAKYIKYQVQDCHICVYDLHWVLAKQHFQDIIVCTSSKSLVLQIGNLWQVRLLGGRKIRWLKYCLWISQTLTAPSIKITVSEAFTMFFVRLMFA